MTNHPQSCHSCQKSFVRLEHLKRHVATHASELQFKCQVCEKHFARKDTLTRHQLTHQNPISLVQTKGRACNSCVAAKVRCTGKLPCTRCCKRAIECQFSDTADPVTRANTGERRISTAGAGVSQQASESMYSASHFIERDDNNDGHGTSRPGDVGVRNENTQSVLIADTNVNDAMESTSLRSASITQNELSGIASTAFHGSPQPLAVFDPSYWTPNVLSNINWLPNEAINLDYADNYDHFPLISSIDTFLPCDDFDITMQSGSLADNVFTHSPESSTTRRGGMGMSNSVTSPYLTHHSPHSTASLSGATSINDASTVSGEFYVDGSGARLPRAKRRRIISSVSRCKDTPACFSLESSMPFEVPDAATVYVSDNHYEAMKLQYDALCLNSAHFKSFKKVELLPQATLNYLVENYWEHFHPTFPFLHKGTFNVTGKHFALLLSMASLGLHFVDMEGVENILKSLNEFIRRLLLSFDEVAPRESLDGRTLAQIQLLHSISTTQSTSTRSYNKSSRSFRDCVMLCDAYLDARDQPLRRYSKEPWTSWADDEETRRTRFSIWLLDAMTASQAQRTPLLKLDTVNDVQLPCHEKVWTATSVEEWQHVQSLHPQPSTLQVALQNLYIEKRLFPDLGEFSRILLIHALYHRTWEVKTYTQQGLSHFEPSAQKQSSEHLQLPFPIWHPTMVVFNKWRNSACDCLDILHWSANATIGSASGIEHPTVLHLHFARVVLLSPLLQILRLTKYFATIKASRSSQPGARMSLEEVENDKKMVQQWAIQDQYKARLAAVHAGVGFWHVRRYSINAFYEPDVIALSALMLWAISAFSPKAPEPRGLSNLSPRSAGFPDPPSQEVCDIILLDRPTDDELVQQFVRQGHTMHANMTGVGDLFGPAGPQRVLREGLKLLETLGAWKGATQHWITLLQDLEKVTAKASASITGSAGGGVS